MNKNTTAVFATYQARRTKKQKTAFAQYICSAAAESGFVANVETTKNKARNIVVGDVANASVVYTAHYDTASESFVPSFIFPKAPILTTLYQVAVALAMLVPSLLGYLLGVALLPAIITVMPKSVGALIGIALAVAAFVVAMKFVLCGKACENTANSNTSGVATLLEIMANLPGEYRNHVAFVFLDAQENGFIGAADFAKKHKNLKHSFVLNFDCVGVGDHFIVATKKATAYNDALNAAFSSEGKITAEVLKGAKRLPSDHNKFKCSAGVSAFTKKGNSLSLVIKSNGSDTACDEGNIAYATAAAIKLVKYISNPGAIAADLAAKAPAAVESKVEAPANEEPKVEAPAGEEGEKSEETV